MRMPRVRFTVRGLMIAVAVVGVMLGGWALSAKRRAYLRQAKAYRQMYMISGWSHHGPSPPERRSRYLKLKAKYEHAARYPWLTVAPDPPEPKD